MTHRRVLLSIAMMCSLAIPAQVPQAVSADDVDGLDLVILVDESASLKQTGVQKEISAITSLVTRRELSSETPVRVSIIGFGSGPSAADVKCGLTEVTTIAINQLVSCAAEVRLRTKRASRDTDFAAAFRAANIEFERAPETPNKRAVILMTDGIYDPVGRRKTDGLSAAQVATLNSALAEMSAAGIQVWPLGFGNVNEQELANLAVAGAEADCPAGTATPYATVASGASLGEYLLQILEATLCQTIEPPKTIPTSFDVHPLVSRVSLTVRGALLDPIVVDGTGSDVCDGKWSKATDGSIACQLDINGQQVGTWTITASADAVAQVPPTVETSVEGRVSLALVGCTTGTPSVEINRQDGSDVRWDVGGGVSWPQIAISSGSISQLVTVDQSSIPFALDGVQPGQRIEAALAPDQPEFIWLRAGADACDYYLDGESTESTYPGGTGDDPSTDAGSVVPWVLIVLFLLLVTALAAWLRVRQSRFPFGTELKQVKQSGPASSWSLRADLGGMREIGLLVDGNGWLTDAGSTDGARYVVKKSRKSDLGEILIVSISETTGRQEHYFSFDTECVLDGLRFKVELPQEIDDELVDGSWE